MEAQHQEEDDMTTPTTGFGFSYDDPELEAMKQRVKEMEAEAEKLRMMQEQVVSAPVTEVPSAISIENKEELDSRSVYVGNVDYGTTPEELQAHFGSCGQINRITILCDAHTGHPKGFAYVEFSDPDSVTNALALNESLFRARQLKVSSKRTNVPGLKAKRFRARARAPMGGFNPYGRRARINTFRNRRAAFM